MQYNCGWMQYCRPTNIILSKLKFFIIIILLSLFLLMVCMDFLYFYFCVVVFLARFTRLEIFSKLPKHHKTAVSSFYSAEFLKLQELFAISTFMPSGFQVVSFSCRL